METREKGMGGGERKMRGKWGAMFILLKHGAHLNTHKSHIHCSIFALSHVSPPYDLFGCAL